LRALNFSKLSSGKMEKIFYIRYKKDGKLIEEKVGRQFRDHMTPAKASKIRAERIEGRDLPNRVKRELERKKKERELNRWTIDRLWEECKRYRPDLKGIRIMASST